MGTSCTREHNLCHFLSVIAVLFVYWSPEPGGKQSHYFCLLKAIRKIAISAFKWMIITGAHKHCVNLFEILSGRRKKAHASICCNELKSGSHYCCQQSNGGKVQKKKNTIHRKLFWVNEKKTIMVTPAHEDDFFPPSVMSQVCVYSWRWELSRQP